MKRESIAAAIGAVLLWLGFHIPADSTAQREAKQKLILAVVGEGLKDGTSFSEDQCEDKQDGKPKAQESACAMARGVWAAYNSKQFKKYQTFIQYQQYNDWGKERSAEDLARAFQNNASILAVIGHSYSVTTSKATPIYNAAQIPLLIPIATDPRIGYEEAPASRFASDQWSDLDVGPHLSNVFRLVPNDKIAQAPTIAYLVDKLSETANSAVLADPSVNGDYVNTLKSILRNQALLKEVPQGIVSHTNCDPPSASGCIVLDPGSKQIDPELVVFIGTTKPVDNFLSQVVPQYRPTRFKNLKYIILTDGCKNVNPAYAAQIAASGMHVLITFPAKHLNDDEFTEALQPLKIALNGRPSYSYEEFGYDSVLLLALALDHLKQPLSRPSLLNALSRVETIPGLPTLYILDHGENVHPDYGIYGAGMAVGPQGKCDLMPVASPEAKPTDMQLHYLCTVGFDEVNIRAARGHP